MDPNSKFEESNDDTCKPRNSSSNSDGSCRHHPNFRHDQHLPRGELGMGRGEAPRKLNIDDNSATSS